MIADVIIAQQTRVATGTGARARTTITADAKLYSHMGQRERMARPTPGFDGARHEYAGSVLALYIETTLAARWQADADAAMAVLNGGGS